MSDLNLKRKSYRIVLKSLKKLLIVQKDQNRAFQHKKTHKAYANSRLRLFKRKKSQY